MKSRPFTFPRSALSKVTPIKKDWKKGDKKREKDGYFLGVFSALSGLRIGENPVFFLVWGFGMLLSSFALCRF